MSKKGRQRRTPEQRYATKDTRSTLAYALRLQREVEGERMKQAIDAAVAKLAVSETVSEAKG